MARKANVRRMVNTGTNKRYARRDEKGASQESDDVGRSSTADRCQHARTKAPKGEGFESCRCGEELAEGETLAC